MIAPTPDELIEGACYATGLSHLGAPSFREGLEHLAEELHSAPLTNAGRNRLIARTSRRLRNRLVLEAWFARNAFAESAEVAGPVVVVGLPRSGTTALVSLLALGGGLRFLRGWETYDLRPAVEGEAEERDPRRIAASLYGCHGLPSELSPFTISGTNVPQEDFELLGLEFCTPHLDFPLGRYVTWWLQRDKAAALDYHKRALRFLQGGRPGPKWLLKSPVHLFCLEEFVSCYPGAIFVMTHRDPVQAIISWCELSALKYRRSGGGVDEREIGPRALRFWAEGVQRALTARARLGAKRFVDVQNQDLLSSPMGSLASITEQLGLTFSKDAYAKALCFMACNRPRGRGEEYSVSAKKFGLTVGTIEKSFEQYVDLFGAWR